MFVKICANTNLEDALLAAELGADAVGFVFAPSTRQVTPEQVADIVDGLPAGLDKVGVFASRDPFEIEHTVANTGLTAAQLHGAYDAKMVSQLADEFDGNLKIIQTVAYELDPPNRAATDTRFIALLKQVLADPLVWCVLIDAKKAGASGGLGLAFDWKHVAGLIRTATAPGARVLLAGGLAPANVTQAIADLAPWGVDVASGVESTPGRKDPGKLRAFLEAARS